MFRIKMSTIQSSLGSIPSTAGGRKRGKRVRFFVSEEEESSSTPVAWFGLTSDYPLGETEVQTHSNWPELRIHHAMHPSPFPTACQGNAVDPSCGGLWHITQHSRRSQLPWTRWKCRGDIKSWAWRQREKEFSWIICNTHIVCSQSKLKLRFLWAKMRSCPPEWVFCPIEVYCFMGSRPNNAPLWQKEGRGS